DAAAEVTPCGISELLADDRAVGAGHLHRDVVLGRHFDRVIARFDENVSEPGAGEGSFNVVATCKPFLPRQHTMKGVMHPLLVDKRHGDLRPELAGRIQFRAPRSNADASAAPAYSGHIREGACVVATM